MNVAVAFDHRGVHLRDAVMETLRADGHVIVDLGTDTDAVRIDYPDKAVVFERLFQKIDGTELHGLDRKRDIAMPGDDHDRELAVERLHALEKFNTVNTGHADIRDHASEGEARKRVEELHGIIE